MYSLGKLKLSCLSAARAGLFDPNCARPRCAGADRQQRSELSRPPWLTRSTGFKRLSGRYSDSKGSRRTARGGDVSQDTQARFYTDGRSGVIQMKLRNRLDEITSERNQWPCTGRTNYPRAAAERGNVSCPLLQPHTSMTARETFSMGSALTHLLPRPDTNKMTSLRRAFHRLGIIFSAQYSNVNHALSAPAMRPLEAVVHVGQILVGRVDEVKPLDIGQLHRSVADLRHCTHAERWQAKCARTSKVQSEREQTYSSLQM